MLDVAPSKRPRVGFKNLLLLLSMSRRNLNLTDSNWTSFSYFALCAFLFLSSFTLSIFIVFSIQVFQLFVFSIVRSFYLKSLHPEVLKVSVGLAGPSIRQSTGDEA
jgi:cellulose synthase/poly-beta-1,6-N-acetylglucosamine synthase-like glycosyltransferase